MMLSSEFLPVPPMTQPEPSALAADFGRWTAVELSAENHLQFYVPEGFAHGFCVTSDTALVHYMCSREFKAEYDSAVAWNDPDIGIEWPLVPGEVSARDSAAPMLRDWPADKLPPYL